MSSQVPGGGSEGFHKMKAEARVLCGCWSCGKKCASENGSLASSELSAAGRLQSGQELLNARAPATAQGGSPASEWAVELGDHIKERKSRTHA